MPGATHTTDPTLRTGTPSVGGPMVPAGDGDESGRAGTRSVCGRSGGFSAMMCVDWETTHRPSGPAGATGLTTAPGCTGESKSFVPCAGVDRTTVTWPPSGAFLGYFLNSIQPSYQGLGHFQRIEIGQCWLPVLPGVVRVAVRGKPSETVSARIIVSRKTASALPNQCCQNPVVGLVSGS